MWLEIASQARWALDLALESWRAESQPVARIGRSRGDPILLLHGFAGTPQMLRPLGRALRADLERPTLDFALGLGLGDIRDAAGRVHQELLERDVARCDIVAYSMGGLVATYLLKCLDQGRRVRRVVTLGTPHRGVPLASDWRLRWASWCRSATQMRVGSPFLAQLLALPLPAGTGLLSLAGERDALVPPTAAHGSGERWRNLVVPGIDHWSLLTSRRVFRCAGEGLQGTTGARPREVERRRASARESARREPLGDAGRVLAAL